MVLGSIDSGRAGGLRGVARLVVMGAALCLMTGCLSPRYKHASKKTPPAVMLNVNFPGAPLEARLDTLIFPLDFLKGLHVKGASAIQD